MDIQQDRNNDNYENGTDVPQEKEVLCNGIRGTVKWFNVKLRYGFVCREDTKEDVFIHQSAISKANPEHPRKSVDDGEEILFDVVQGNKGPEAANVTGIDGNCVRGSEYALRTPRGRGRGRIGNRSGNRDRRSRGHSDEIGTRTQEYFRGGGGRGKPAFINQNRIPNKYNGLDNSSKIAENSAVDEKICLAARITGKVKWFNVKRGYGFVCRNDNKEDVFIHHSAIIKSNPKHNRKSVQDGEEILFDVVSGIKGNEVANVSALDGNCVRGSEYALRYPRAWRKPSWNSAPGRTETVLRDDVVFRGGGPPLRIRRPFRGGGPGRPPEYVPFRDNWYNVRPFDYYPPPPMRGGFGRGGSSGNGRIYRDEPTMEMFERRQPPLFLRGRPRNRGWGRGYSGGRPQRRNDSRQPQDLPESEVQVDRHE